MAVNFLGLNPFQDQAIGKRTAYNVPHYRDVGMALDRALGGVRAVRTETGVLHGLAAADGTLLELMSARAASPSGSR